MPRRWPEAGAGWASVAMLLALVALAGWRLPHEALDWQPALAWREPWRTVTAVGVHYSVLHLVGNLIGVVIAGLFGVIARVPARLAWAWFAAWPLTQFGLLTRPDLMHFGGLSGVLHAGVAAVVVWVSLRGAPAQRAVAAAIGGGLVVKLLLEQPWGEALRHPTGWGMATAPLAHTTGALAGAACAALALVMPQRASAA